MAASVTTPVAVRARNSLSKSPTAGVSITTAATRTSRSVRTNCGQVRRKSRSDSTRSVPTRMMVTS